MFDLIHSNAHFIVVDKHPDVSFHCEEDVVGLFQAVKDKYNFKELYPVHRLDKITSGIVIFALSKDAASEFGKLFESKQIDKYYLAISDQKPVRKQGLIKGDMRAARRGAWKLLRTKVNPAITQFFSIPIGNGLRLYLIKPKTGKTHQIRVALKSNSSAILGDNLYYAGDTQNHANRGYLHAFAIRFQLFNEAYEFKCPPNIGLYFLLDKTQSAIVEWDNPWALQWPKT